MCSGLFMNKNGEGMEGWEEDNKERGQPDV